MIVKLAGLFTKAAKPTRMKQFGKWLQGRMGSYAHEVPTGVALTGGIAIADGVTRATIAPKGHKLEGAKHGLLEGALYGAALSVAEPLIGQPLKKAMGYSAHG